MKHRQPRIEIQRLISLQQTLAASKYSWQESALLNFLEYADLRCFTCLIFFKLVITLFDRHQAQGQMLSMILHFDRRYGITLFIEEAFTMGCSCFQVLELLKVWG